LKKKNIEKKKVNCKDNLPGNKQFSLEKKNMKKGRKRATPKKKPLQVKNQDN